MNTETALLRAVVMALCPVLESAWGKDWRVMEMPGISENHRRWAAVRDAVVSWENAGEAIALSQRETQFAPTRDQWRAICTAVSILNQSLVPHGAEMLVAEQLGVALPPT